MSMPFCDSASAVSGEGVTGKKGFGRGGFRRTIRGSGEAAGVGRGADAKADPHPNSSVTAHAATRTG
jgi:hypothetical protein